MSFKIFNDCCADTGSSLTTGSYIPQVYAVSNNFFKPESIAMETAIYTKINNVVSVYGTLKADYAEINPNSVGTLQILVPPELTFDVDSYVTNTVGAATFSGGQSGVGPVTGVFLQKHELGELTPGQPFVSFEIATTNDLNVDPQINVPFTYSFTYITNATN
jgi:hypothetical protein